MNKSFLRMPPRLIKRDGQAALSKKFLECNGIGPIISASIEKTLTDKSAAFSDAWEYQSMGDNAQYFTPEMLERHRHMHEALRMFACNILQITHEPPVIFIRDKDRCFTDDPLEELLRSILEPMEDEPKNSRGIGADVLLRVIYCDLNNPEPMASQIPKRCVIFKGGSLKNTYQMYGNQTSENDYDALVKRVAFGNEPTGEYHCIVGICHGGQGISNTIKDITIQAPYAQWGYYPQTIVASPKHPDHIDEIIRWFGGDPKKNKEFVTGFTRGGQFIIDKDSPMHPLIMDAKMWVTAAYMGSQIFIMQGHCELDPQDDRTQNELLSIKEDLEGAYGKDATEEILWNFTPTDIRSIGPVFYVSVLLAFLRNCEKSLHVKDEYPKTFDEARPILIDKIKARAKFKMEQVLGAPSIPLDLHLYYTRERKQEIFKQLSELGFIVLNTKGDWKVNRGKKEVSSGLGFKKIESTAAALRQEIIQNGWSLMVMMDVGPGDGTLIREMQNSPGLHKQEVLFYWVAREIFIDIYAWLQGFLGNLEDFLGKDYPPGDLVYEECIADQQVLRNIPWEVLILFVEEFLRHYEKHPDNSLHERLVYAAKHVELTEKIVHMGSMFSDKTYMFPDENTSFISQEALAYLESNDSRKQCAAFLGNLIVKNIARFSRGYIEQTYLSDFSEISNQECQLPPADLSVGMYADTHLPDGIYESFLEKHLVSFMAPGGVFLSNGLIASYTRNLRLYEMARIEEKYPDLVRFRILYDPETRKIKSAIMERAQVKGRVFRDMSFWEGEISPGYELKTIREILALPRIRLEIAIREFLNANFRTHEVFKAVESKFDAFLDQVLLLQKTPGLKKDLDVRYICSIINHIVTAMNEWSDTNLYEPIAPPDLLRYKTTSGESIAEFLDGLLFE